MTRVYTTGVFDLLHPGHISTLRRAAEFGDELVVGVQEDDSVYAQKGQRPAMTHTDRVQVLSSLPFVSSCVTYSNTDQREMLDTVKPDVMVQTSEWAGQTDRSPILDLLKERGIRFEELAIDKTISSTEIKKRVMQHAKIVRDDARVLRAHLRIMPITDLSVYEQFDPRRTEKLVDKIQKDGSFFNPIVVAQHEKTFIVVDGANRLEALRRIGCTSALVHVVQYADTEAVELRNNAHFLSIPEDEFKSVLAQAGFELHETATSITQGDKAMTDATCAFGGKQFTITHKTLSSVDFVNALVETYIGKHEVYRLSELSQDAQSISVKIVFRTFGIQEILDVIARGEFIQSGITWHKMKHAIVRFHVPLAMLQDATHSDAGQGWLEQEIERKIAAKDIRYYPTHTYICDEWS